MNTSRIYKQHQQIDIIAARRANDQRLASCLESIYQKYGKDFDGVGDEIDLINRQLVIDNGHLESLESHEEIGGESNVNNAREKSYIQQTSTVHASLKPHSRSHSGSDSDDPLQVIHSEVRILPLTSALRAKVPKKNNSDPQASPIERPLSQQVILSDSYDMNFFFQQPSLPHASNHPQETMERPFELGLMKSIPQFITDRLTQYECERQLTPTEMNYLVDLRMNRKMPWHGISSAMKQRSPTQLKYWYYKHRMNDGRDRIFSSKDPRSPATRQCFPALKTKIGDKWLKRSWLKGLGSRNIPFYRSSPPLPVASPTSLGRSRNIFQPSHSGFIQNQKKSRLRVRSESPDPLSDVFKCM
ncbi:hypothetical protein LOZ12_006848 [Ophidiomyces ophidiicola]|uniref:uncharacterized protein n=1 Tax=Ophidiomyces ophidiicola TaxID=1387563 RepID=UPI0020C2F3EE|nr:uncharacterized protein LOZ57_006925 [Ophidiomyces ophidiicola]KAI1905555.1 hypothetical protein LOZ64_006831 [Ophidiomyces ophidiicola]KAI1930787.1 hypothetical protein LOZ62_006840 [Ophidiomyces ophidiicola]KAI1935069.1 hypothetical protein LOZ57_006925 [Ophidiomyces ophidiicola]KAI2028969.1 hypothetical protein LOZ47_006821 [Ophidiomyces ophidiicola]KAI2042473.1 hypothetical protein LOZ43_006803 [Ophidiomyces ophidiicola]